jgi:hypothetical protein
MVLESIAVTAIGVLCRLVVRRSAVTVISCSASLDGCAVTTVWACSASGTSAASSPRPPCIEMPVLRAPRSAVPK